MYNILLIKNDQYEVISFTQYSVKFLCKTINELIKAQTSNENSSIS